MEINYAAPINTLGYGVVGLNVLKSLVKQGHDVALFNIGSVEIDKRDLLMVQAALDKQGSFFHGGISLRIFHQNQMAQHVGYGVRIGFPIFELEDLNDEECHHLSSLDRIVVTSEWAKQVILNANDYFKWSMPDDIVVAPLGVDTDTFCPALEQKLYADKNEPTRFLNIGKWEKRKGHGVLIECFTKAFDYDEKVELWLMCHNPFLTAEQKGLWESMANSHPNIKLIPRVNTHAEVAEVMRQVDCGVFPALAEGWNLELLEMMAVGHHVITTDATAHTGFCTARNSLLIPHSGEYEDAFDGVFFHGEGRWMKWTEEQDEQLITHMKQIHRTKQGGMLPSVIDEAVKTAKEHTWDRTAKAILSGM